MNDPDVLLGVVVQRIQRTHGWLLKVSEDLPGEQLARSLGATAPPIGWHLWHIARWADRVQASFPNRAFDPGAPWDPLRQLWFAEGLAGQWKLDPATLGILETGAGMAFEAATQVPRAGKDRLVDYARRAFAAADARLAALDPAGLSDSRNTIMEYTLDDQAREIADAPGAETTVAADLGFHLSHASRHLGMMEGLRGLLDMHGTASA